MERLIPSDDHASELSDWTNMPVTTAQTPNNGQNEISYCLVSLFDKKHDEISSEDKVEPDENTELAEQLKTELKQNCSCLITQRKFVLFSTFKFGMSFSK